MSTAIESQWDRPDLATLRCQRLGVMNGFAWAVADSLPGPYEAPLGIEMSNVLACGEIGGWGRAA